MSDVISIARRVTSVDVAPQFTNYSKVIIHVSDELAYEAGNDTGRALEIDNPFGTQQMAERILTSLVGYQYQPYYANGALLDPAAEIGDAVNMRGAYGGIYTRERTFGRLMKADVSAPHDEEINHEYQYESPERREFKRSIDNVKASLIIMNDNIEAKVAQESPEGQTSFSWRLLSDSHRWYANGREVMSVTASGLKVSGEVEATSGKIGDFNIKASAIWNGIQSFGATSPSNGVYVGTDGIQLGQGVFMWPSGTMALRGSILFQNSAGQTVGSLSAANLYNQAQQGSSAYSWTNSNGSYCYGGASYGYNFDNMKYGGGYAYPINASSFRVQGAQYVPTTISFRDYYGNTRTWTVLALLS